MSPLRALLPWLACLSAMASGPYRYICQDAGAGGYESFPDLCRLRDGRLACVFYAGYDHISLPNTQWPHGGRVAVSISSDEGRTWSAAQTWLDTPDDDRDPSITQLADGRLALTFFTYAGEGRFATCVAYSSDAGKHWAPHETLVPGYAVSSPIREIEDGHWILGVYWEDASARQGHGAVIRSHDFGRSWTRPIVIDNAGLRLDAETDVVALGKGRLWAAQRGAAGVSLHGSFSSDNGRSWSRSVPTGFEGHCPYLVRTTQGAIVLAVREFNPGPNRGATTLRLSSDNCRSWSEPVVVDSRGGSYPSIVALLDGSFLIVWYEDKASKADIRCRTFRISGSAIQLD